MQSSQYCEIREFKRSMGISGGMNWMWFEAVCNDVTIAKSEEFPFFSNTPEEVKISEKEKMNRLISFVKSLLKDGWHSDSPGLLQKTKLPDKILLKRPNEGK